MSRTRSPFSDLLSAFAEEEKISVRRARDLRRINDLRWTTFANRRAAQSPNLAALASGALPPSTSDPVCMTNLEDALKGAVKAQEASHSHLLKMLGMGDEARITAALKMNRDALSARMEVEKFIIEEKVRTGHLVSMDACRAIINRVLSPLVAGLEGLAASTGQRCNPSNPNHAQRVIEEAVNELKAKCSLVLADLDKSPSKTTP
jgi:hypothetical protein